MKGIDAARVSADSVGVWCAGSRSGLGRIYRTAIYHPADPAGTAEGAPEGARVHLAAAPNPFGSGTTVRLRARSAGSTVLDIIDARGRQVRRLNLGAAAGGAREALWDGRDHLGLPAASGIYYAVHRTRSGVEAVPLILVL